MFKYMLTGTSQEIVAKKKKYARELKGDAAHDVYVNSEDGHCKKFQRLCDANDGKAPQRGGKTTVDVTNSHKTRYEVLKGAFWTKELYDQYHETPLHAWELGAWDDGIVSPLPHGVIRVYGDKEQAVTKRTEFGSSDQDLNEGDSERFFKQLCDMNDVAIGEARLVNADAEATQQM